MFDAFPCPVVEGQDEIHGQTPLAAEGGTW